MRVWQTMTLVGLMLASIGCGGSRQTERERKAAPLGLAAPDSGATLALYPTTADLDRWYPEVDTALVQALRGTLGRYNLRVQSATTVRQRLGEPGAVASLFRAAFVGTKDTVVKANPPLRKAVVELRLHVRDSSAVRRLGERLGASYLLIPVQVHYEAVNNITPSWVASNQTAGQGTLTIGRPEALSATFETALVDLRSARTVSFQISGRAPDMFADGHLSEWRDAARAAAQETRTLLVTRWLGAAAVEESAAPVALTEQAAKPRLEAWETDSTRALTPEEVRQAPKRKRRRTSW